MRDGVWGMWEWGGPSQPATPITSVRIDLDTNVTNPA